MKKLFTKESRPGTLLRGPKAFSGAFKKIIITAWALFLTFSFAFAQLPAELAVSLMVRGPHRVQGKRRGGRRARQGVTPLFSSKGPRR